MLLLFDFWGNGATWRFEERESVGTGDDWVGGRLVGLALVRYLLLSSWGFVKLILRESSRAEIHELIK